MELSLEDLPPELRQLRSLIRQDLREELSHAFAGYRAGPDVAWAVQDRSSQRPTSEAQVLPGELPCDADDQLRVSASQKDDVGITDARLSDSIDIDEVEVPNLKPCLRSDGFASAPRSNTAMKITRFTAASEDSVDGTVDDSAMKATVVDFNRAENKGGNKRLFQSRVASSVIDARRQKQIAKVEAQVKNRAFPLWDAFEGIAALAIFANAVFMGAQSEIMSVNRTEDPPRSFLYGEIAFCVIFSTELMIRVTVLRGKFCDGASKYWHGFDVVLVTLSVFDVILETIGNLSTSATSISFLRLLRMLRLLRVMRVLRLLKFFGELNVVTSTILNSFKSLWGTVLMLFLMIYVFAIAFNGAANSKLVQMKNSGVNTDGTPLDLWWSGFGRTVLSLYQAILGGVDWDDLTRGLMEIHFFWTVLFLGYISFMILTLLNVMTGIFVDSAVKHAQNYHEKAFATNMRQLFKMGDSQHKGTLTREEFDHQFSRPDFHYFMKELGIEPIEVQLLFDILHEDNNEDIRAEDLLAGMLRLRAGAKFIDIMNLQHEIEHNSKQQAQYQLDILAELRALAGASGIQPSSVKLARGATGGRPPSSVKLAW